MPRTYFWWDGNNGGAAGSLRGGTGGPLLEAVDTGVSSVRAFSTIFLKDIMEICLDIYLINLWNMLNTRKLECVYKQFIIIYMNVHKNTNKGVYVITCRKYIYRDLILTNRWSQWFRKFPILLDPTHCPLSPDNVNRLPHLWQVLSQSPGTKKS